jgi:beta-glucosidase
MSFPDDFTWGVSAASYQIEGAVREDGKGPSVWDVFCRKPAAVWNGHTGDVACDHYHRYKEDVALMAELGIAAYRLSICWPRVLPEGTGRVNPPGLDFYGSLIDELLDAGIEPWVTLFHWDYPQALFRRGGWLSPHSPDWFAEFATLMAETLGDRVTHWITLNEPQVFIDLGHRTGEHAPGLELTMGEVLQASHNVLLAHGKATQAIRANAGPDCRVGFAPATQVKMPATDSPEDLEAARQAMFSVTERSAFNHTWWMDPVFNGRYPEDGLKFFGEDVPDVQDGDMETISQPMDFFGCNIYHGRRVRAGADGRPELVPLPVGYPMTTQMDWPITPECLYWGPRFFHERYGSPIVITENGHQNADFIMLDGQVHDPQRIDYLHRHLLELGRAIEDGVPVDGYFQWTFMDNFEWALGYGVRVGLVYTDYPTQMRVPKDSAYWYRDVIASNGGKLSESVDET